MTEINIDIEALVLEGFSHIEAYKIKQALESELSFLIRYHGTFNLATENIQLNDLKLGTINLMPGQNTTRVGQRIAGAIFQQLYHYTAPGPVSSNQSPVQTLNPSAPMSSYNSPIL